MLAAWCAAFLERMAEERRRREEAAPVAPSDTWGG